MAHVVDDLRYAIRSLRRSPAFVTGVVLTLTVVIAASVTVLGIVNRVLLRPLPLAAPHELYTVFQTDSTGAIAAIPSYPTTRDFQAQTRLFAGFGFARGETRIMRGTGGSQRLGLASVSAGFLPLLGVRPALGRLFTTQEEGRQGGGDVVVISHALWQRLFGGDPGAIGRTLSLQDRVMTVIGVTPREFKYPDWADAWTPAEPRVATVAALQNRLLHVDSRTIARLAPGATLESARAELNVVARRLNAAYPDPAGNWTATRLTPLADETIGTVRSSLYALAGAVFCVLLIACANVANLTLVRASTRSRELAVRAALGADRRRIARQLLTESMLLAVAAGMAGTLSAIALMGAVRRWAPASLPRTAELAVDWRTLLGAACLTMLAGALIGTLPALRAGRVGFGALRDGRGMESGGARGARARAVLTVGQMTLALMLIIGAGLLVQSFRRLQDVRLGYNPENMLALSVFPPEGKYEGEAAAAELYRRLIERVSRVPGVTSTAFVNHKPGGAAWVPTTVSIAGRAPSESDGGDQALYKTVSAEYLDAVGLKLLKGRWFTESDIASKSIGVVISESVARRFFPGVDPIGRPLTVRRASQARAGFGDPEPSLVIGLVGDVRQFGPSEDPAAEVYLPYTREVWAWGSLLVRTSGNPRALVEPLQRAVTEVDADIPVTGASKDDGFRLLADVLDDWYQPRRLGTALLLAFSLGAVVLAAVGLYTVTAYGVVQRTGEIGIRLALGATPAAVVRLVLGHGLRLTAIGALLGAAGALALGRLLGSMLYATTPADPLTLVLATLTLGMVVLLATFAPARRAARLDPTIAMRGE
jgi:putative ABC transport system permease protein